MEAECISSAAKQRLYYALHTDDAVGVEVVKTLSESPDCRTADESKIQATRAGMVQLPPADQWPAAVPQAQGPAPMQAVIAGFTCSNFNDAVGVEVVKTLSESPDCRTADESKIQATRADDAVGVEVVKTLSESPDCRTADESKIQATRAGMVQLPPADQWPAAVSPSLVPQHPPPSQPPPTDGGMVQLPPADQWPAAVPQAQGPAPMQVSPSLVPQHPPPSQPPPTDGGMVQLPPADQWPAAVPQAQGPAPMQAVIAGFTCSNFNDAVGVEVVKTLSESPDCRTADESKIQATRAGMVQLPPADQWPAAVPQAQGPAPMQAVIAGFTCSNFSVLKCKLHHHAFAGTS
eukprot:symbB.v1.2.025466.t1/scaffold2472.1/size78466/4